MRAMAGIKAQVSLWFIRGQAENPSGRHSTTCRRLRLSWLFQIVNRSRHFEISDFGIDYFVRIFSSIIIII